MGRTSVDGAQNRSAAGTRQRVTVGLPARTVSALLILVAALGAFLLAPFSPSADAQELDIDAIAVELEREGYYIEAGAEGSSGAFADLVDYADRSSDAWYFVSLSAPVDDGFVNALRDAVQPSGNVLVYYLDGEFVEVALASAYSESVEQRALEPFQSDWEFPEDFMRDVVDELDAINATTSSGTSDSSGSSSSSGTSGSSGSSSTGSSGSSSDSGGGSILPWLLIPAVLLGGFWFVRRRGKKKQDESELGNAEKIRNEIQTELDELANDVIVLSEPIDLSEKDEAITHYREATDTYLDISDDLPDLDELKDADPKALAELGARVAHARWQMDAAEAILDGEPIPEKPKVAPPPQPPRPTRTEPIPQSRLPQRAPRPRVPYSRSRRRSGGGLLDVLIAGSGMLGGRRSGGMFGGSSRSRSRSGRSGGMFGGGGFGNSSSNRTRSQPRRGGGVFGGGSSSSRSSSRRSSSRRSSSSRTSSRRSSSSRRSGRSATSSRRRAGRKSPTRSRRRR